MTGHFSRYLHLGTLVLRDNAGAPEVSTSTSGPWTKIATHTAMNARPALFSGAGAPPATIAGAVVGDWWLNTTTMELSKITGV